MTWSTHSLPKGRNGRGSHTSPHASKAKLQVCVASGAHSGSVRVPTDLSVLPLRCLWSFKCHHTELNWFKLPVADLPAAWLPAVTTDSLGQLATSVQQPPGNAGRLQVGAELGQSRKPSLQTFLRTNKPSKFIPRLDS